MKTRRLIAFTMAIAMTALAGCSTTAPTQTQAPASASSEAAPQASTGNASAGFDGSVTFGVVAPITGTNKMVGEYVVNGAKLALKDINAAGGINGKELKLVFEDEVDNQQASVN
ncbi:MAG: hypothetical protein E7519_12785, partial [Ruminococcaceae bacterium]|nr:hypothetical protein [Oscillospiraceae bacterium]